MEVSGNCIPEGEERAGGAEGEERTTIFRSIAIPSSLRTVAPFLDEAQAHAG